jgi:hypothetical protein
MPARAPLANRVEVSNCFVPCEVNHWGECYPVWRFDSAATHLLELFICCKLNGAVRYDSNAIDPIPSHESLEPLLFPHANETSPHSRVLLAAVPGLDLSTSASVRLSVLLLQFQWDTYWMILSRSSGDTTVRDAAPATPPAMK